MDFGQLNGFWPITESFRFNYMGSGQLKGVYWQNGFWSNKFFYHNKLNGFWSIKGDFMINERGLSGQLKGFWSIK